MQAMLLANPAARGGTSLRLAERAAAALRARGVRTSLVAGGSAAESGELLRAGLAAGVDAVLVAGGDGTVRLALQHLAGSAVPLGVLAGGTGNDFAAALGVHDLDPEAAAAVVAAGRTRRMDLARVERADGTAEFFGTVLASGFDSRVNDRANAMRRPRGRSRYTIALLREFATLRGLPYLVELDLADGTHVQLSEPLVMATVGNTRSYGGGIPICPEADPADGLLDVTLVRPAGRMRLLRLLPRVYAGSHGAIAEVSLHRVRAVRLSSPGITGYADGDPIGPLPLTVRVAPGALEVFVPA